VALGLWTGSFADPGFTRMRYTADKVLPAPSPGLVVLDDADLGTEVLADRWIPRLSIGWHASDTGMAYASIATGFRSGQTQPIASLTRAVAAGIDVPIALEPDTLVSYELGFKRLLAGGRLRMQGAVFNSRWHDLPVRVPIDDVYNALANSDGARVHGAELEVRYLPSERLDLSLGVTFSEASYTADVADTPIRRGMAVYNVPRVNLAGSARYAWQYRSNIASIGATLRHHSRRETGLLGRDYAGDPITAIDLRFGLESLRWGWFVYGNNLTNERGAVGGRTTFDEATRLHPRTMGLEVQYRY
jgi:iron complex outermembrane recepter protein